MQFRWPHLLILLAATSASAQVGHGKINSNNLPGDVVTGLPAGSMDLTAAIIAGWGDDGSGMNDFKGVARVPNGNYILSEGPNGGPPDNVFKFFEVAPDGTVVAQINQQFINGANGDFGITDLSWDKRPGNDSRVWGGRAKSIISYDWQAQIFDPSFSSGENGLHLIQNLQGSDVRACAIGQVDGTQIMILSDNNRGPLGAPDLADANYIIMGIPLPEFPVWQPATPSTTGILGAFDAGKSGAAFDEVRNTVWWHMDDRDNSLNPNQGGTRFDEMDLDGNLTGMVIQGNREIAGRALGCGMYVDAQGNSVISYLVDTGAGVDNPLGLTGGNDILVEMYVDFGYGGGCGGTVGYQTEPFIGNLGWTVTLENAPANPISAAFLFRGKPVAAPGLVFPGLLNCGLLLDLGSLIGEGGTLPLVNGAASFVRPLPDSPSLIGAEAGFQWLLPTTLGVLPLDLSNAGVLRIGSNL